MPLSDPAPRRHIHTRTLDMRGYEREDGLWDIEGHLRDTKSYGFDSRWRGRVEAGDPIHEMHMRLTIDGDMVIHNVEAVTDAHPFPTCPEITPNFKVLEGTRIGIGWYRKVRELLGGVKGCTHHVEMLSQLATVTFQTMAGKRRREEDKKDAAATIDGEPEVKRPRLLNTCYAFAADGEVVKEEYPSFYKGKR